MKNEVMKVFNTYTEALSRGDFEAAFETMADTIVWHMGGESSLSGIIKGKQALGERLGEFAERSNGTFRVMTEWAASNDCFVAASVVSLAEKGNEKLDDPGIDLFKIEDGKLLPPFNCIPALGNAAAGEIVKVRNEHLFTSKADLKKRGKVSQSIIDTMEYMGILKGLPEED